MNAGDLTDTATRVALLARPGVACERLHAALQQAGADIVLVADPADYRRGRRPRGGGTGHPDRARAAGRRIAGSLSTRCSPIRTSP